MANLAERFWAKVQKRDGCWEWTASTKSDGYGQLWGGPGTSAMLFAHRVSWELHYGLIPDGLCVLHRCDNPPCCNPAHLFLGTRLDNATDMAAKGRAWNPRSDRNRAATHCPQGHPYSAENTYPSQNGRKCKTCSRARGAVYRSKHRDEINAKQSAAHHKRMAAAGGPQRHGDNFAKRTACGRGHPYTPESTLLYKGARFCRICQRVRRAERLERTG